MPPAPDPNVLRRDRTDDQTWTTLAERAPDAEVPKFPLDNPTPRELHWWADAFQRPQATEWIKRGEELTVALFCRVLAQAEAPNAPVTIHRPRKQLRDELGLSVDGLRRRRWLMPGEKNAAAGAAGRRSGGTFRPGAGFTGATGTPLKPGAHRTAKERFNRTAPTSEETSR